MAQATIGISPAQVTAATAEPEFRLGTVAGYDDPTDGYQEFIYGRASGVVTGAGYVCVEETAQNWAMATLTTTAPGASGPGSRAAVAQAALADNEFGWFQIYGKGGVRTSASAAKGTQLNSTATGGQLDDDATAGAEVISGVVLGTATAGAAAVNTDATFSYPTVLRTL